MEAPLDPDGPIYVLKSEQTDYRGRIMRNWLGVTCEVREPVASRTLLLHVWGGGIDNRVRAADGRYDSILLASRPRSTHEYYFTQLEEVEIDSSIGKIRFKPVSETRSIQTSDNPEYNYITLVFDRER